MKKLYQLNKIALVITAILYLTIIFGLYAQIVLGGLQLLSALIISFFWGKINTKQKKHLLIYWAIVLIYGIGWYLKIEINNLWWILGIIIIPMSVATYFVWILSNLKRL
jgi:hypothetical protein